MATIDSERADDVLSNASDARSDEAGRNMR